MQKREAVSISNQTLLAGIMSLKSAIERTRVIVCDYLFKQRVGSAKVAPNNKQHHKRIGELYGELEKAVRDISKEADYLADECKFIAEYYSESYEDYQYQCAHDHS